jgi:SAM-dependent methyltransferase
MSTPQIYDRRTYAMRRARAERAGGESFLVSELAQNLVERLSAVNRRFAKGLDLGSRTASFEILRPHADRWIRTGLATEGLEPPLSVVSDEEAMPFAPASLDLIASVLSLHAVNDLPGALLQIRQSLKPDGLFLAALFGGSTLGELRNAFAAGESDATGGVSAHVAPFADLRDLGGLLQRAGFSLPVADVERLTVRYSKFTTLVQDLRAMGETNALQLRQRKPLARATLAASLAHYAVEGVEPDGRLRATFDIVYLTGWAPHESQPKPLSPGSARMRLAEALGTKEHTAGEPATPKPLQ